MSFDALLDRIESSSLSHEIAGANHLWTAGLQVIHVIGFTLLASWALLALHAFGLVLRESANTTVMREAHRLIWLGLAFAAVTGLVMVLGAPHHYFGNPACRLKLSCFFVGCCSSNHHVRHRHPIGLGTFARIGTTLSALLWLAVSFAGRAIGFV